MASLQDSWVERVLGIAFARPEPMPSPSPSPSWAQARTAWQDATEDVDRQIEALTRRLRADPDPEMQDIAEFGLNALTGGHRVGLAAALVDADRDPAAAARLRDAIDAFARHVATDERIAACDRCPDLPISIATTVGAGLRALSAALPAPSAA